MKEHVYEELIGILGPNRAPESADLPLMLYTERVIKETLRIFPVGGFFLRTVSEDIDMGEIANVLSDAKFTKILI